MEPARRLGHFEAPGASGAGQRGRLHRRPERHRAPRPGGPGDTKYLLAGLLSCGRCGRRLESAWSNGKPAYRCRHGYTSATSPDLARPGNTYVREDQILPHLAAVAILLGGGNQTLPGGAMQVTAPGEAAGLIDQLRTAGITLTYDPDAQTIRTGDSDIAAVTIGHGR